MRRMLLSCLLLLALLAGCGGEKPAETPGETPPAEEAEPVLGLADRLEEVGVADGLQEIVEGIDFITIQSILLEGGGEDDTCFPWNNAGKLHAAQFGHLDVEEKHVHGLGLEGGQRLERATIDTGEGEEGRLPDVTLEEAGGERLVVDDGAGQHVCVCHVIFF